MDTQMEFKLQKVRPNLVKYASAKWSGLRSMTAEDLAQETLIYAFQNYHKWKDLDYYVNHCCRAMDYIAHNILLKEHKDGLWLEQALTKAGERKDIYNLTEVINSPVECLHDPWLDKYKERHRQTNRAYYERHKEKYKNYYQKHKEEHRNYMVRYTAEDKVKWKKYYQDHKEQKKEYHKQEYEQIKQCRKQLNEEYGIRFLITEASYLYRARNNQEEYQKRLKEVLEQAKARSF